MNRYLKEILIAVYFATHYDYYFGRISAVGIGFPLVLFAGMFVVLTVALFMTAYIRRALIRHALALVMCAAAVFFDVYTRVTADYLTYSSFVSLVYSGGFIEEALYQYRDAIIAGVLGGVPLLLGIGLKPRRRLPVPGPALVAAPLLGCLLYTSDAADE